jgi:hypothetical protein
MIGWSHPLLTRESRRPPAMPPRRLALGLCLLALVACAPQRVTVVPEALRDRAPISAQVDPHLFALTERWASGGTAGDVAVGELLRQVLVDDPQAPLRLSYITSQLHVATVVSPTFYRPRAYEARYQLIVQVEASAIGARQAWLHAAGESRTLVSAARATTDATAHAVRELCRQVAAWRAAGGPREGARRSGPDDPAGEGSTHGSTRAEGIAGGRAPGDILRPASGISRRPRPSIQASREVDQEPQRADMTDVV